MFPILRALDKKSLPGELPARQPGVMAVPYDYDSNPARFRLGVQVTDRYLTGAESIYAHIVGMLGRAGTHLIADIGCGESGPDPSTQRSR